MLSIPIVSCINRYKKFLYPSLLSLTENSDFNHEIIVVSEDSELEKMIKNDFGIDFIFKQKDKTLTKHKVPYDLFNVGFRSATCELILAPTGDDNYYPEGWDRILLQEAYPAETMIWMPTYIEINTHRTYLDGGGVGYSLQTSGQITAPEIEIFASKYLKKRIVTGKPWKDSEFPFCPNAVIAKKIFGTCGYFPEINDSSIAADAEFFKSLYKNGVSVTKVCETYIANLKDVERILQ